MGQPSVTHSTFSIERSFPVTPELVFAAFADPAKKRRWFAEAESLQVEEFDADFRVGGKERTRFRSGEDTPLKGAPLTNETVYQDIVLNRRIVLAYTMTVGGQRISASLATFEFLPAAKKTTLIFTERAAFLEGGDGPKMREEGWRQLLGALAKELAR